MKAPENGGLRSAPRKPAMKAQGFSRRPDVRPTTIARMLSQVFDDEKHIASLEHGKATTEDIERARNVRDNRVDRIKHAIDFALNDGLYESVECSKCRLPSARRGLIAVLGSIGEWCPPVFCDECDGEGVTRRKKNSPEYKADLKRVRYFKRVLDDTLACAKIRANTSDANDAYLQLEKKHIAMLKKFSNEKQTGMEYEDAAQGARMGLIDAAQRFDPTRKSMAAFSTVAYNWCFRNTRVRHDWQKRPGLYAPSIDAFNERHESDFTSMLSSSEGALMTFTPDDQEPTLVVDMRNSLSTLPDEERQVIEAELRGLSTGKIAKHMGCSKPKVRRLRESAYETLRGKLSGYVKAIHD